MPLHLPAAPPCAPLPFVALRFCTHFGFVRILRLPLYRFTFTPRVAFPRLPPSFPVTAAAYYGTTFATACCCYCDRFTRTPAPLPFYLFPRSSFAARSVVATVTRWICVLLYVTACTLHDRLRCCRYTVTCAFCCVSVCSARARTRTFTYRLYRCSASLCDRYGRFARYVPVFTAALRTYVRSFEHVITLPRYPFRAALPCLLLPPVRYVTGARCAPFCYRLLHVYAVACRFTLPVVRVVNRYTFVALRLIVAHRSVPPFTRCRYEF